MDFKLELKNYIELVNEELKKYIKTNDGPEKNLYEAMEYGLMVGGKRIRPTLMISTYKLFKQDFDKCFPFAIAMEMIHNFSLIHDDLPAIDNDDLRRGNPTNHKKYGECTAILAGDALLNNAYSVISNYLLEDNGINLNLKLKAFNEFSLAVHNMIVGEYIDTEFEGKPISNEYLEYIHNNKTAELIKASVRIGGILAEAPEERLNELTKYAEKIGLAFQIKDDILSVEGDVNVFGKPIGNDEARGKCTYVTKYGLEYAKQTLNKITKEAVEIAERFNEEGEFLKELAIYIAEREK
ncbi:MAG: polyprenyl synthetase family protein [Clostridia bacterium]|nr:polyprenyl synthetase family protein [Clostridia bacterium]